MELSRWQTFTKHQQLLMIGSEIARAHTWQGKDVEKFRGALERAFPLVDFARRDPQWGEQSAMFDVLRDELDRYYQGTATRDIIHLYQAM